jgi:nicotinamide-nucleotide amidase
MKSEVGALVERVTAARGERTLATAESCTAGAVAQALAAGEGASTWFRGGVVAYHRGVKYEVLAVPQGPVVNHVAARAMAQGAAHVLRADVAVSVTGAAGPDGQDGASPGTVFIGYWLEGELDSEEHHFDGSPESVCDAATRAALDGLGRRLGSTSLAVVTAAPSAPSGTAPSGAA